MLTILIGIGEDYCDAYLFKSVLTSSDSPKPRDRSLSLLFIGLLEGVYIIICLSLFYLDFEAVVLGRVIDYDFGLI